MKVVDVPELLRQDSLIWIGKTPSDWKYWRLKDVAYLSPSFSSIKPEEFDECTLLPMEKVSDDGTYDTELLQPFIDISSGLNLIEAGDVIIAKITPCMENGKGAFISSLPTSYAFGSTEFHVFRPTSKIDATFLYYYTWNPIFRKYAEVNMTGAAGQKRISSRFIKHTKIFLPPVPEQKLISAYLDKTTAIIDKAVYVKKEQLKKLKELKKSIIYKAVTKGLDDSVKMIDSGIEWIGEVPERWAVTRLKRTAYRVQTGTTPPTERTDFYVDGTIPWYGPACFDKKMKLDAPQKLINESAYKEKKLRLFKKGSIFWVGIGATIGKVGIIDENSSCNQQVIGSELKDSVCAEYIYYFLLHMKDEIPKIAQYTTLPIMDQEKFGYLHLSLPTYEIQQDIASFLNSKMETIFSSEEKITLQIQNLEDYKKSLIHECVTGKRRITENDIPEAV